MLCPFGPSECRHLERSPCLRQGITPQRDIGCTIERETQATYEIGILIAPNNENQITEMSWASQSRREQPRAYQLRFRQKHQRLMRCSELGLA